MGKLSAGSKNVQEARWQMLFPMIILSLLCVIFGLANRLISAKALLPAVKGLAFAHTAGSDYVFHSDAKLVVATVVVLVLSFLNHIFGVRKSASALHAADHIRYAPVLSRVYDLAEKKVFDPYEIGLKIARFVSRITFALDKSVNWVYDILITKTFYGAGFFLRRAQGANYPIYLIWSLVGSVSVIFYLLYYL